VGTGNINLVPSVICLGAFLGPVVFVAYVYERARDVPLALLLWCFIVGGVLSPAGHAAWTGLVCAALWRARLRPGPWSSLAVVAPS
jgi:RsiW-degrading membrane proteinase PrsW (M82 family)